MNELDKLQPGDRHYKAYVGPIDRYDFIGASQFNLLTSLGLKQNHSLLDIGCGSLRAGKLFIPYLGKGNYVGIEPNSWLIEEGLKNELGETILEIKKPQFFNFKDFRLSVINKKFDYIVAQSIFSHASAKQINICLSEVKMVLKENGIFAVTFIHGKNDYDGQDWVYPGCVQYTTQFISNTIEKNNLSFKVINWKHPKQQWYLIYHPSSINAVKQANSFKHTFLGEEKRFLSGLKKIFS